MPFDSAGKPRGNSKAAQANRKATGALRNALRRLEPGQCVMVHWPPECSREDYRRTVVYVCWSLWGSKAASVVPVERGCLVTRHGQEQAHD